MTTVASVVSGEHKLCEQALFVNTRGSRWTSGVVDKPISDWSHVQTRGVFDRSYRGIPNSMCKQGLRLHVDLLHFCSYLRSKDIRDYAVSTFNDGDCWDRDRAFSITGVAVTKEIYDKVFKDHIREPEEPQGPRYISLVNERSLVGDGPDDYVSEDQWDRYWEILAERKGRALTETEKAWSVPLLSALEVVLASDANPSSVSSSSVKEESSRSASSTYVRTQSQTRKPKDASLEEPK